MEAAKSFSRMPIKPIPYLYSYRIKDEKDTKRLLKYRLKPKNLVLNEYQVIQNKWIRRRRPLRIKKACFSHLKGLCGLHFPFASLKIPPLNMFSKQICWSIRNLSLKVDLSARDLKGFEKYLTRMKRLISLTDLNTNFGQGVKGLFKLKGFGNIRSLALPCHIAPRKLDKVQEISIDLEKLEQSGEIPKLPLSLRELSLIDKNPLDENSHMEVFRKLKDQLNSLKSLKFLNLIFPKKSYYHHNKLFSDLKLKNLTITVRTQVDFSETILLEMEEYIQRTGSEIKIIPTEFSKPQEYVRLLNLFGKKQGIRSEKVLYPFDSTGDLHRQIINYSCKMLSLTNEVEFLFDFVTESGWFDSHNISNFKEMMDVVKNKSSQDSRIVYHFIHKQRVQLIKPMEKEIIQAAADLLRDQELGREIMIKVSSDIFGFEMLKSLMPKLFQESCLKVERISWEHACLYIAGLPEILNDLKSKRKIKDFSLITYQK